MNIKKKAAFYWSGGKDSALSLQKIFNENEYDVVSLITSLNEETHKSSVHSIPLEFLKKQADSIGLPLYSVLFAKDLKNYDQKTNEITNYFRNKSVTHFIFGDIFSEMIAYRENKFNPLGIQVVEPLAHKTSEEIMEEYLKSGIKTKIIVTLADKLDRTYIGKDLDEDLIKLLPENIDICGENGEYHTVSYGGNIFKKEIIFSLGEIHKISYDITLDNGKINSFEYWQAEIII
ncbi:hypothetical protein AGMMS49940_01130 [Spirochaetia bacterium]|nr:hypothetical protein AGMMS49940_01130 [Spirochaetia bacterium]